MNIEVLYQEDANNFIDIMARFKYLQDNDFATAYQLHKDSLAQYDRWSQILFEVRREELGTKRDPALKDRIEDILRILNNVYTSARMVWNKSKDDISEGKY
jgi:inactivated superfamily I helicase